MRRARSSARDGDDAGPRAVPGPPEEVTAGNVGEYVAAFEETYRHNVVLATADVDRVTSITANYEPTDVTEDGDGYRVTVECGFGWMFEDDGNAGVADGAPYRATYRAGGGLIERVGSTLAGS